MKPGWTTLIAGLNLLIAGVVLVFLISAASDESFYPAWFGLFFLYLGLFGHLVGNFGELASGILTMMIPALFFFAWNPQLFRGRVKVPRRSYALFAVGALLSLDYSYSAWSEGLRVQGVWYTYALFSADIALVAALGFMFARTWNPRLFRGGIKVPRRSYALFAVGAVLSLGYFLFEVHGVWYTYALFAADIALVAALGFMFAWRWKGEPSFSTNLFLHWTLFAWFFWFAFPFLGHLVLP